MNNLKTLLATTALLSAFALPAAALVLDTSVMLGMVAPEAGASDGADAETGPATGDGAAPTAEADAAAAVIARTADPESEFMGDTVKAADGEVIGMVEAVLVDGTDGGTTLVVAVMPEMGSKVTQFTLDIPGGSVSDGEVMVSMNKAEVIGILENNM